VEELLRRTWNDSTDDEDEDEKVSGKDDNVNVDD